MKSWDFPAITVELVVEMWGKGLAMNTDSQTWAFATPIEDTTTNNTF